MFLCVWLYFKKFSEKYFLVFGKCYKGKTNPSPPRTKPRLTLDARDLAAPDKPITIAPSIAISRSTAASRDRDLREGEIAIDGAISRSVDRDLASTAPIVIGAKARSRSTALVITINGAGACERRRLVLLPLANGADPRSRTARSASPSRALALSLSLSLSLRNSFEVKIGTEIHFRSQSLFFSVNGNQFPENSIFWTNQTPAFPEKHFRK